MLTFLKRETLHFAFKVRNLFFSFFLQGTSQRKAAELLSIPQGTLNRHLKNRKNFEESEETNRKQKHTSNISLVDKAVKEWLKQSLDQGADFLSGQLVREKAEEFAKKMFKVIEKQVKVGSQGSRRERVWCTKIAWQGQRCRFQQREIGLHQCSQAFGNNMMRKTFLMLMKQASIFVPCLTQH